MLPTQSGEPLSSDYHREALMRRQTRPFTVEIKNSRKPISIRKPVPIVADRPRTEPLLQDLLLGHTQEAVRVRSPAQEATLSEARSVFSRLANSASGPAQSSARLKVVPQGPEREASAPEQTEPPQARILPDLLSLSRAGGPLSPEAEKRTAQHRKPQGPKTQERVEPATEKLPGRDQVLLLDADPDHSEPAEVERPALSDPLEVAAVEQGAMPLSRTQEVKSSPRCV